MNCGKFYKGQNEVQRERRQLEIPLERVAKKSLRGKLRANGAIGVEHSKGTVSSPCRENIMRGGKERMRSVHVQQKVNEWF